MSCLLYDTTTTLSTILIRSTDHAHFHFKNKWSVWTILHLMGSHFIFKFIRLFNPTFPRVINFCESIFKQEVSCWVTNDGVYFVTWDFTTLLSCRWSYQLFICLSWMLLIFVVILTNLLTLEMTQNKQIKTSSLTFAHSFSIALSMSMFLFWCHDGKDKYKLKFNKQQNCCHPPSSP